MIIGVDPGSTTGIARFETYGKSYLFSNELPAKEAIDFLDNLMHNRDNIEIACEKFTISPRTLRIKDKYEALYIIGWLYHNCRILDVPFYLYTTDRAKSFSTDTKLKKLDIYNPSKGGHQNDAARQLVLHLSETDPANPWLQRGLR